MMTQLLIKNSNATIMRWLGRVSAHLQPAKYKPLVVVSILYSILVMGMSYPVAWDISSGIAGHAGDSYQHLWLLWWAKKSLVDLQTSLSDVTYLYFPQGAYHPILQVTPLIQVLGLPLVLLFGPVVAYNLGFLAAHILSGISLYLLAFELTEDHYAAFLGGLIFAFAPTRFIHGVGHYAQIMTYLFPLYALSLIRLIQRPSLKHVFLTTVTLTFSLLVNFVHIAYFIIPTTLILVAYYAWTQRSRFWEYRRVSGLALAFALAALFTAPFFLPFLRAQSGGSLGYLKSPGVSEYGADLLAFFVPSPTHPILKGLPAIRETIIKITSRNVAEGVVYLGLIPLLLALWAMVKTGHKARPWAVLAVLTMVFSLGPLLKINGEFVTYAVDDKLSYFLMPYALLTKLPFYESARTPARINGTTIFALAILASLGVAAVLNWLRSKRIRPYWPIIGLTPLILFEYATLWPYPMAKESVPEFYTELANEPGEFGILDYPLYLLGNQSVHSLDFPMYYQLTHQHPIVGGYVWRMPPETVGTVKALNNLVAIHPEVDIVPLPSPANRAAMLDLLNIRYVIVHKQDTQSRDLPMSQPVLSELKAHLSTMLNSPIYEDQYIMAFRVPMIDSRPEARTTSDSLQFVALGENWHALESEDGAFWRWTANQRSSLYVYGKSSHYFHLSFDAESTSGPRQLELLVNGSSIGTYVVHKQRAFVTPDFALPLDNNVITLKVNEACVPRHDAKRLDQNNPCQNLHIRAIKLIDSQMLWGENRVDCEFGEQIRLLGYDLDQSVVSPGQNVELTLYWQATKPIELAFTVFTHIVSPNNELVGQRDNWPVIGQYPTNWWAEGEIIIDKYTITVSSDAFPKQNYRLTTGLYEPSTGERLPISSFCPKDSPHRFVELAEIEVKGDS